MCCIRLVFRSRAAHRFSSAACMFACIITWMSCRYDGDALANKFDSRAGGCAVVSGSVGEE
eukprot:8682275-Pyramimonas_sp.AAC.1